MEFIIVHNFSYILPDINECASSTDNCHSNASCDNTNGSFLCNCNKGYSGTGHECEGTELKNYTE